MIGDGKWSVLIGRLDGVEQNNSHYRTDIRKASGRNSTNPIQLFSAIYWTSGLGTEDVLSDWIL